MNMNSMGGPVGSAPIPMMNGTVVAHPPVMPGPAAPTSRLDRIRPNLNAYIYDYFIRNRMYECARSIYNADPSGIDHKAGLRCRNENGTALGNGHNDDPGESVIKDDLDSKVPDDLPVLNMPTEVENSFLLDWFCVFWEMYHAQRTTGVTGIVPQYVNHTQAQSRLKQHRQQEVLRQIRPDLSAAQQQYQIRAMNEAAMMNNIKQGNLARTAMANNQNNPQVMMHAKPNHMQRDLSDIDGVRQRVPSPGPLDTPSPAKRPRLDGAGFNPNQPAMNANGRPTQGLQAPTSVAQNSGTNTQMIIAGNAINGVALNPNQFSGYTVGGGHPSRNIATYSQTLQQHHGGQISNKPVLAVGPPAQATSGMMPHGPDSINAYYNPGDMVGPGMRGQGPVQAAQGGNALQEYQTQLMMLEAQNKKRLMNARAETDTAGPTRDSSSGAPASGVLSSIGASVGGPNSQFTDASPQTVRAGASPNPAEQMKRGTPQLSNTGIPSPLPEGAQSRGSPSSMTYIGGQIDANVQPFLRNMDGNMIHMSGLRPGSHPVQQFNGQINAQILAQRQQPPQHPIAGMPGNGQTLWHTSGPNGNPIGPHQGPQHPVHGTPQQRSMPPPSAHTAATANRPLTASPQQITAAPPTPKAKINNKKGDKSMKDKRTQKKANFSGGTPSADMSTDAEVPTPATPMTPINQPVFNKAGQAANPVGQVAVNGPPGGLSSVVPVPQPIGPVSVQHADPNHATTFTMETGSDIVGFPMQFANPLDNTGNVLEDFDFDSFLHDDNGDNATFDFDQSYIEGNGEIGAGE